MEAISLADSGYVIAIAALLPLSAAMVITQANPYHALVVRGILGAIAALVYALLGAADVALTEALVGTMLSITLYAIAVRSSMAMRMGILTPEAATDISHSEPDSSQQPAPETDELFRTLRQLLNKYYMRLEIVPYDNDSALEAALLHGDIHTLCLPTQPQSGHQQHPSPLPPYRLETRVQRLQTILQSGVPLSLASVAPWNRSAQTSIDRPMELSS
ncbi:MAG: DUF4040 domain-containing protein [Cyanobacteria bacterium J06656_5]